MWRNAVSISVVKLPVRLPYSCCGFRSSPAPSRAVGLLWQGLHLGECPHGQAAKAHGQAGHRAPGRGGRGTSGGSSRPEVPAEAVSHHGRGVSLHGLAPRPCRECGRYGSRFQASRRDSPHQPPSVARMPSAPNRLRDAVCLFPKASPERLAGVQPPFGGEMKRSRSDRSAIQASSASDGAALITLPMMFVSSMKRIRDRPRVPPRGDGSARCRRR